MLEALNLLYSVGKIAEPHHFASNFANPGKQMMPRDFCDGTLRDESIVDSDEAANLCVTGRNQSLRYQIE